MKSWDIKTLKNAALIQGYFLDRQLPEAIRTALDALTGEIETLITDVNQIAEADAAREEREREQKRVAREGKKQIVESASSLVTLAAHDEPGDGLVGDRTREPVASYANRQSWTKCIPEADVEKVRTMSMTMTDQEIGAEYGCSRWTVIDFRAAHGIGKRKGKRGAETAEEQGQQVTPEPGIKPRKPWSPEARAAAAERMRAMQAAKKAKRNSPGEA